MAIPKLRTNLNWTTKVIGWGNPKNIDLLFNFAPILLLCSICMFGHIKGFGCRCCCFLSSIFSLLGIAIRLKMIQIIQILNFWCTFARWRSTFWASATFASWPFHVLSTDDWRARPYEKDRVHGFSPSTLLMAFKFWVASISDWPPDRKTTP